MQIGDILSQIDLGSIALPKFQRGYVWNRDQVRNLMRSLYRKHPIGSLLVWVTETKGAEARGNGDLAPGSVKLLLDGQQRITSLYGIIRGKSPKFFDGRAETFSGLYFNLDEETFEFYAPVKMKDNPLWIDVTKLMQIGVGEGIMQLNANPDLQPNLSTYINRLNGVSNIKAIELHIEEVAGADKTVDVVVDIFNIVNSGGTKLSKGDLALAKICTEWPEAREEMKERLGKWRKAEFDFRLEWLLRTINTIVTGEALFSALRGVDRTRFAAGLEQAEKAVDYLINLVSTRLGLDHGRVLGSQYSFPLMARYLVKRGGHLADHKERDKLLYWYVHTFLWGRYAGSTETALNRDLALIEQDEGALDRLVDELRRNRGDLRLEPRDFTGWSQGARFYSLLYMLTRVWHAKDWGTGLELSSHLLGYLSSLQLHHIFPKAQLYKHGYSVAEANAIANFTFLTQETNLGISDRLPEEYLEEFVKMQPGAVESHWIPMQRELWRIEKYREFLDARRELLAKAANEFLDSLLRGAVPETPPTPSILEREGVVVPGGVSSEEEKQAIQRCREWLSEKGLPEGDYMYELTDPNTGDALAVVDLAWPNGLQEGYSQPIALLIDEGRETEEAVNRAGYRYFTDISDLRGYVQREILAEVEAIV